jgi:hypothetical protein
MKTLDAWIVLQMWFNGLRSNSDSMATLELFFIHNLNILCCASSPQRLNKGGTNGLDSPYHINSGSQYQVFNISKCLAKLFSQSSYNLYYGYVMPMASSKVHWRNWLSNFLISCVVALANHPFKKEKHWSQTKPPNSQQIKMNHI